jgi:superfamily II DNA or RNA helicase
MKRLEIVIFNTSFTVKLLDEKLNSVLNIMINELSTYDFVYDKILKRNIRQRDKMFMSHLPHTNTYRFSIMNLKDFMLLLGSHYVTRDMIHVEYRKNFNIKPINIKVNSSFTIRDYQHIYINALVAENATKITLIDLQTGRGKSVIAMAAIAKLNMRTGLLLRPKYIEKWIIDLKKYTDVTDNDIYIVQGEESLLHLIEDKNTSYKFVIFSSRTMMNLITDFEECHSYTFPITPDKILETLGIGIIYNDETHEEFYSIFKCILYLNPLYLIGSSATLLSNQPDVNKMYMNLFPATNRISNIVEYDKYANVIAINYKIESLRGIRFMGVKGYNHILFEQTLMRNSVFLREYINMIDYYIADLYISRRKPGDRMLIFAASIRMCTVLANHFDRKYKQFDVRRYVEDDPLVNVLESDICFSTTLSAGTALDIPNLIAVLQTVLISSIQANLQNVGRLRKLDDGREVYYGYLYSKDIPKQVKMHHDRTKIIKPKAKTYILMDYPKMVRTK